MIQTTEQSQKSLPKKPMSPISSETALSSKKSLHQSNKVTKRKNMILTNIESSPKVTHHTRNTTSYQTAYNSNDKGGAYFVISPNRTQRTNSESNFKDKLKRLEYCISSITAKGDIKGEKLQSARLKKSKLETRVNFLLSNIRTMQKEDKTKYIMTTLIDTENNKYKYSKDKAYHQSNSNQKEIKALKSAIEIIKLKIASMTEENSVLLTKKLQMERDIQQKKDTIKSKNAEILLINKEKKSILNEIMIANKHNNVLKDKIHSTIKSTEQFLYEVESLMKTAKK